MASACGCVRVPVARSSRLVVVRGGLAWPGNPALLPSASRLRSHDDFRATVREGVRVGRTGVVVHMRRSSLNASRAGLVVSKAVGDAVTRNRVKRQLRHLLRPLLESSQLVVDVVVRALPACASGVDAEALRTAFAGASGKLSGGGRA